MAGSRGCSSVSRSTAAVTCPHRHSACSSLSPARPRHRPYSRKPLPAWEAWATAPLHPAGERARSPHSHSAGAGGGTRLQPSGVALRESCHRSRLLLRPRCPLQPLDFLWGQGMECPQARVAVRPSAAHRYTARYNHSFSITGIMHRTRLFIRSAMR